MVSSLKENCQKPPLTPDDLAILKKMVGAFKSQKIDFASLPPRPRFKGPRLNAGITCNAEVKKRALAQAKSYPDSTGGSLSGLVELLLWKFLGSPSDVVEKP